MGIIFKRKLKRTKPNISPKGNADQVLFAVVAFLVIFGLVLVYDSSVIVSSSRYNDQFRFLKLQLIWVVLGTICGAIAYFFDYKNLQKIIFPILAFTILLLIFVLIAGPRVFGSKRWFDIGLFNVQPSELTKLVFTIYLASWLSKVKKYSTLKDHIVNDLIPFALVLFFVCFLIIIEPDLGTAAIVGATALVVYFLSGTDSLHTIGSILIIFTMILVGIVAAIISPYRFKRVQTFVETIKTGDVPNKTSDGYQINQVLIAVGSGGLFGIGFGESRQKFFYLVGNSAFTDTIFAVFAEEFGFFGCVLLVLVFFLFILRGIFISKYAPDRFGALLAAGITTWISFQFFLNIGANIALGPLTGIPLPFISYGGSSMVVTLTAIGILLNISKNLQNRTN